MLSVSSQNNQRDAKRRGAEAGGYGSRGCAASHPASNVVTKRAELAGRAPSLFGDGGSAHCRRNVWFGVRSPLSRVRSPVNESPSALIGAFVILIGLSVTASKVILRGCASSPWKEPTPGRFEFV